jgi:hypothetical protein
LGSLRWSVVTPRFIQEALPSLRPGTGFEFPRFWLRVLLEDSGADRALWVEGTTNREKQNETENT